MGERTSCPSFTRAPLSKRRWHWASTCVCGWSATGESEVELARQESKHTKEMKRERTGSVTK